MKKQLSLARAAQAAPWIIAMVAVIGIGALHVLFGAYILMAPMFSQPPIEDAYIAASIFFTIGAVIWVAGYGARRFLKA